MMGPRRRGAMVGSWQGRRECPYRLIRARLRYQGGAGGRPARPGGSVLHCERGSLALTQFKLAQVIKPELERPIALVTIDNGADHMKPTVFGRSAFESLEQILGELEADQWAALVITGKPYFFSAGADLDEFSLRGVPELAREGS